MADSLRKTENVDAVLPNDAVYTSVQTLEISRKTATYCHNPRRQARVRCRIFAPNVVPRSADSIRCVFVRTIMKRRGREPQKWHDKLRLVFTTSNQVGSGQ